MFFVYQLIKMILLGVCLEDVINDNRTLMSLTNQTCM